MLPHSEPETGGGLGGGGGPGLGSGRGAGAGLEVEPDPERARRGPELEQLDDSIQLVDKLAAEKALAPDSKLFRQYDLAADRVKDFYHEQHMLQTVAYNLQARVNFRTKTRANMGVWQALLKLTQLLDELDPDTELSQMEHAIQTAEAIRRDGRPRWMQLVGLIHDLGKLLYFYGSQGQWDVVGDTFPVGCKFSNRNIFADGFARNPDARNPLYNTKYGLYLKGCGLKNVMLSWGHDEYMYHVAKESLTLPREALAMIRYHSFYPWHQQGAYTYLMDAEDEEMLVHVREFNQYDLYSKGDEIPAVEEVADYYKELIDEFFPSKVVKF